MIKPAYSVSFLLSINIFVGQNVLYFLDAPHNNLLTAIGLLLGGSSSVHAHNYERGTKNLKSEGLHEKHALAAWSFGNHLSICLWTDTGKPSRTCAQMAQLLSAGFLCA